MLVRCPNCGSSRVRSSAAAYDQGVSRTSSAGGGLWASRRRIGAWQSRRSTVRVSAVAERNAPPTNPLPGFAFGVVFILCLIVGPHADNIIGDFTTRFLLALSLGSIAGFTVWHWIRDEIDSELNRWTNTWYCSTCGNNFSRDSTMEQPSSAANTAEKDVLSSTGQNRWQLIGSRWFEYLSRVKSPVQRAKTESRRDIEGLLQIDDRMDSEGLFDPEQPYWLDLGLVSRLASLGYLTFDEQRKRLSVTESGKVRLWELGRTP